MLAPKKESLLWTINSTGVTVRGGGTVHGAQVWCVAASGVAHGVRAAAAAVRRVREVDVARGDMRQWNLKDRENGPLPPS